jgi:hypothetical protein
MGKLYAVRTAFPSIIQGPICFKDFNTLTASFLSHNLDLFYLNIGHASLQWQMKHKPELIHCRLFLVLKIITYIIIEFSNASRKFWVCQCYTANDGGLNQQVDDVAISVDV